MVNWIRIFPWLVHDKEKKKAFPCLHCKRAVNLEIFNSFVVGTCKNSWSNIEFLFLKKEIRK